MIAPVQVLDPTGRVRGDVPVLPPEKLVELYEAMVRTRILDTRMLALQRQGRIGFYGTCKGQEAATVGSGLAVGEQDWVFPALREGAVLLLRGFPLERYVAQLIGNALDECHGRQMPCHFSSGRHNFVSLSSPIGTQILQGMGARGPRRSRAIRTSCSRTSATARPASPTSTPR